MTLGLELLEQYQRGVKEGREEGREEGILVGQERILKAIEALKNGESMEDIISKYEVDEKLLTEYQKIMGDK